MKRYEPCRLATVCVPWDQDGAFLEPVFRRQVRLLLDSGFENLYARLADPEFPLGLLSPYQDAGTAAFEKFKTWISTELPDLALEKDV